MHSDKVFKSSIKGAILSVFIVCISILVFSLVVLISGLNDKVIKAVNQFIKIIAVFISCMLFVRESKGLIKGLLLGLISGILTHLLFFAIGSSQFINGKIIIDIIFTTVVGVICGILSVNLKR
jgi:putative membrane protein (TIGR04086 family)